jgi:hypothetical protein
MAEKTTEPGTREEAMATIKKLERELLPQVSVERDSDNQAIVKVSCPRDFDAEFLARSIKITIGHMSWMVDLVKPVHIGTESKPQIGTESKPQEKPLGPHERINRHGIRTDKRAD